MDCDEMSGSFDTQTPVSRLKIEVAEYEESGVSVHFVESPVPTYNLFPHKTSSPLKAVDNSDASRSQQRRSSPMDYRQLAGMRPKTWLVQSAEGSRNGRVRRNGHRCQADGLNANTRRLSLTPASLNKVEVGHVAENIAESEKQSPKKTVDSSLQCNNHFKSTSVSTHTIAPGNILTFKPSQSAKTSDVCQEKPQLVESTKLSTSFEGDCDDSHQDQSIIPLPVEFDILPDHTYYSKHELGNPEQKLHHTVIACPTDYSIETDCHEMGKGCSLGNCVEEFLCSLDDLDKSIVLQYPAAELNLVTTNGGDTGEQLAQCVTDAYLNTSCSTETASICSLSLVHDDGFTTVNEDLAENSSLHDSLFPKVANTNSVRRFCGGKPRHKNLEEQSLRMLPKASKPVRHSEHCIDIVDEVTVVSFKSEWQLKKYVSWHCKASGISLRRITSKSSVRLCSLQKKRNCHRLNGTRLPKSDDFEWQVNRGNIKKLTEEEVDKLGLRLTPGREDKTINQPPLKHAIRWHRQSSRRVRGRPKRVYTRLNCARKRVRPVRSYNLRAAKVVVDTLDEEKDSNECDEKIELVTVTATQAQACSECVHTDWIESGVTCIQPGCAYGCICRLFIGKRFSRTVAGSFKQRLLNTEAYIACLKAQVFHLGYGGQLSCEVAKRTSKPQQSVKRPRTESGLKHDVVRSLSFNRIKREKKRISGLDPICSGDKIGSKDVPHATHSSPDHLSCDANSTKNSSEDIKTENRLPVVSHKKLIRMKRHFVRNLTLEKFVGGKNCSDGNSVSLRSVDKPVSEVSESAKVSSTSASALPSPQSLAKITTETPSAVPSSTGISLISNERVTVDEEQTRSSSDSPRFEDGTEPDETVKPSNDQHSASCDSPLETPVQQTFRRQMVLFQHNQNGGRPCLLEIMSNCGWDSARSSVLGRLFAVTADSAEYPPICTFIVDTFRVEIQPRASQKTLIPLDLRDKLHVARMHAVRVKVTVDGRPEPTSCPAIEQQLRQSSRPASTSRPNCMETVDLVNRVMSNRAVELSAKLYLSKP